MKSVDLPEVPSLVRADDGSYLTADERWRLVAVDGAWELWDTAPAPPLLWRSADPSPVRVAYRSTLPSALAALAAFATALPPVERAR